MPRLTPPPSRLALVPLLIVGVCLPDYSTGDDDDDDDDDDDGLTVDVMFILFDATLNGGEVVPATVDDATIDGIIKTWFVNLNNWNGDDDLVNRCVVPIALTADTGSAAPEFDTGGCRFGWRPDLGQALGTPSDSCADVDNLRASPVDILSDSEWGFGFDPLGADLDAALEDAYGAGWALYEGSAPGGCVSGGGNIGEVASGFVFETTSSNELVLGSSGSLQPGEAATAGPSGAGHFRTFPAYGFDPTSLSGMTRAGPAGPGQSVHPGPARHVMGQPPDRMREATSAATGGDRRRPRAARLTCHPAPKRPYRDAPDAADRGWRCTGQSR